MMRKALAAVVLCGLAAATEPDAATRNWWRHVQALGGDVMQGRDTGSPEYRKAAEYVAFQLEHAGVKPAGEQGWYQPVPLHRDRLDSARSSAELVSSAHAAQSLRWFHEITVGVRPGLPASFSGDLIFSGPDGLTEGLIPQGKILVQIGGTRTLPMPPGLAGVITIDATGGPEPPRWPVAYAVAVTLRGTPAPTNPGPIVFRFNPVEAELLFKGSGHTYRELEALVDGGKPVPHFAIPLTLRGKIQVSSEDISSDNIIGVLPGSDPALRDQYVVVSAHLDGYGIGEPINGDAIYNGAFDDAAYVATLIDFAERLQKSKTKLKRSVLFLIVTGEEKGLLGSRYFTQHPTVVKERMVADINLDQLRPIFPLKILTTLALDQSTLGETARQVAATLGIRIQPDPEPQRNLLRRSDHWNFIQIGIPAVGFIFGYEPGTADELVYRKWYKDRYHSPADDLNQPWVPEAAEKFNLFFGKLVEAISDSSRRPEFTKTVPN